MSLSIIDSAGLLDGEMQQFTQRRFQFALSRFDSRIDAVKVTVNQAIDDRRTVKHECMVAIGLRHYDPRSPRLKHHSQSLLALKSSTPTS